MAQHDYVIANGTGAAVRSDLNNALAAIVSQNSGATAPATTYAFQFWADTTTGTLKLRNSANSAWIELLQLDGTLTMEDGTEALPGLSFRNDLDTGLWRPGTNQLAISTNAVERVEFGASEVVFNDGGANYDFRVEGDTNANLLFVDASADAVGIGTSSPSSNLHIKPASGDDSAFTNGVRVERTDTPGQYGLFSYTGGAATITAVDTVGSAPTVRFFRSTNGSTTTESARIDSSGRLGIGTTSPLGRLDSSYGGYQAGQAPALMVGANIGDSISRSSNTRKIGLISCPHYDNSTDVAMIRCDSDASSTDLLIGGTSEKRGATSVQVLTASTGTGTPSEKLRIDYLGRLLVGTSSVIGTNLRDSWYAMATFKGRPDTNTEEGRIALVRGEGSTSVSSGEPIGNIFFSDNDGGTYAAIYSVCDGTTGSGDCPGRLSFWTTSDGNFQPTERMRIESSNRVGINITASAMSGYPAHFGVFQADVAADQGIAHFAMNNSGSATRSFLLCSSNYTSSRDLEFALLNNGQAYADGSWNGGGADYAEYFEWSDANPNEEDRRGISVVLDGEKIREAVAGEDPIGVISGNPSVVGDAAWNKWSGKYLRDEFGTYILEDYEVEDEGGNTVVQQRRKMNPAYDPDQKYIPREQRPEWDCVGLMGKLRIRKGQVTGSRWIKMRDISDSVEEWLVR